MVQGMLLFYITENVSIENDYYKWYMNNNIVSYSSKSVSHHWTVAYFANNVARVCKHQHRTGEIEISSR
jgi:hypothetical protein